MHNFGHQISDLDLEYKSHINQSCPHIVIIKVISSSSYRESEYHSRQGKVNGHVRAWCCWWWGQVGSLKMGGRRGRRVVKFAAAGKVAGQMRENFSPYYYSSTTTKQHTTKSRIRGGFCTALRHTESSSFLSLSGIECALLSSQQHEPLSVGWTTSLFLPTQTTTKSSHT